MKRNTKTWVQTPEEMQIARQGFFFPVPDEVIVQAMQRQRRSKHNKMTLSKHELQTLGEGGSLIFEGSTFARSGYSVAGHELIFLEIPKLRALPEPEPGRCTFCGTTFVVRNSVQSVTLSGFDVLTFQNALCCQEGCGLPASYLYLMSPFISLSGSLVGYLVKERSEAVVVDSEPAMATA